MTWMTMSCFLYGLLQWLKSWATGGATSEDRHAYLIGMILHGDDVFAEAARIAEVESPDTIGDRMLIVLNENYFQFERLVVLFSHHGPDHLAHLHWLVFGRIAPSLEAVQPRFHQLREMIDLVYEQDRRLLPYLHHIAELSPLGQAAKRFVNPPSASSMGSNEN